MVCPNGLSERRLLNDIVIISSTRLFILHEKRSVKLQKYPYKINKTSIELTKKPLDRFNQGCFKLP